MDEKGSIPGRRGEGIFLFATTSRPPLVHSAFLSNGYRSSFPRIERPGCEADHSPSSSAKVKNVWSYSSTAPFIFMAY